MAQAVSYGSITIVDTTDIERIYVVYAKSANSSTAPTAAASTWTESIASAPGSGDYIWQRTVVLKSGPTDSTNPSYGSPICVTGPEGQAAKEISTIETQYCNYGDGTPGSSASWQSSTPAYDATKPNYWTRTRLKYDDNTYSNWTAPVKDQALTDAIYNAYVANSIATHAQEDAEGALSQSTDALQRVQAKYGTSSTGASTVAKVANCEGFQLFNGAEIFISFTNKNTATNPTLNVNNTGAKPIKDSDGNALVEKFYWKDSSLVHFVYDGTNWRILDIVTTEKYNSLVSDINGVSQTVGQHTTQISGLGTRVSTAETNITQNTEAISLRATKTEAQGYANTAESNAKDYTDGEITTAKAEIKVTTDGISTEVSNKVGNNEVISKINQSAESITINANRVNIEGATIFTSGRLSTTNLSNTIDEHIPDISGLASKTESIKSVTTETQYRLSNSSTSLTGSGTGYSWSTTIPTWVNNTYLWTRIATTYTPVSGSATTVYKPGTETNQWGIYDSQLTIALSTASTANTKADGAASTVTTTQEYRLSDSSTSLTGSGTGYTWSSTIPTWVSNTYLWTRFKIEKASVGGTTTTTYTPGPSNKEYGIYDSALTIALSTASSAKTTAEDAAPKSSAIAEEQLIYIQATSGTNSVSAYPSSSTTTSSYWVTQTGESIPNGTPPDSATGQTPRWTTKRPSYQKNYPVIFVAKQKKTVSGAITCTTPIKDDTTTIIDGGHITTGTIDASKVTVTNLQASSIAVGSSNVAAALDTKASNSAEYSVEIVTSNFNPGATSGTLVTLTAKVTRLGESVSNPSCKWYRDGDSTVLSSSLTYNVPYNSTYNNFTVVVE